MLRRKIMSMEGVKTLRITDITTDGITCNVGIDSKLQAGGGIVYSLSVMATAISRQDRWTDKWGNSKKALDVPINAGGDNVLTLKTPGHFVVSLSPNQSYIDQMVQNQQLILPIEYQTATITAFKQSERGGVIGDVAAIDSYNLPGYIPPAPPSPNSD
jgi:hypothetical protein